MGLCIKKKDAFQRLYLDWQGRKDSNPRHSVLETDALPTELHPCICVMVFADYVVLDTRLKIINQVFFALVDNKLNFYAVRRRCSTFFQDYRSHELPDRKCVQ